MASRDYTPAKINHFNYTSAEELGVNKTADSENIFKTGHLSSMGDPLTFHAIRKSTPAALI